MQTLSRILITSILLLTEAASAQPSTGPDERYKIVLSINGTQIDGAQERAERLIGKTPSERSAIYDELPPSVERGRSFQAVVKVIDPARISQDYTSSPRLRYEHFGCLTVTSTGTVTATPMAPERCNALDTPQLIISLMDVSGNVINYNAYLFQVVDTPPPRIKINPPSCRANPRLCS
jgi:hypothetical protein